jgi:hypothetical protein
MGDETMQGDMFDEAPPEDMPPEIPPQMPPLAPIVDEAQGDRRTLSTSGFQPLSLPEGGLSAAPLAATETSAPEQQSAPMSAAPPPVLPGAPPYWWRVRPAPPGAAARRDVPWYAWVIAGVLGVLLLAIVGCCALSGLAVGLIGHLRGAAQVTDTSTKTFAVSDRPTLVIHDPAGNVSLVPGSTNEVRIEATKHVSEPFGGDAKRTLSAITVRMTQSGNTITVAVQLPSQRDVGVGGDRSVDLSITTPPSSNLNADVGASNLTIGAITGQLTITAAAGNVSATGVTLTGASRIVATASNITFEGSLSDGASLDIHTRAGDVALRLPSQTPAHLSAHVGVGSMTVSGWPIAVTHSGAAGASAAGDLGPNPTGTITISVDSGTATIEAR